MTKKEYKYVVLGAGLSGLYTAYLLSRHYPGDVLVLEKEPQTGGVLSAVVRNGFSYGFLSYGICGGIAASLRAFPEVPGGISGEEEASEKLRIGNSYIPYPIDVARMLAGLGVAESALWLMSYLNQRVLMRRDRHLTCAGHMIHKAGVRAYRRIYEQHARKISGIPPSLLAVTAANRTMALCSPSSVLRATFDRILHSGRISSSYRGGISAIPRLLEDTVVGSGSSLCCNVSSFSVHCEEGSRHIEFLCGHTWHRAGFEKLISTVPLDELAGIFPTETADVKSSYPLIWRGLRVAYLHVSSPGLAKEETYHFPEQAYIFERVSVIKSASGMTCNGKDISCLRCEIPYMPGDTTGCMSDEALYERCAKDLLKARLIDVNVSSDNELNFVAEVPAAYPVHTYSREKSLASLLFMFARHCPYLYIGGRLGLFADFGIDSAVEMSMRMSQYILEEKTPLQWYSNALPFLRD